ncbi:MAG: hypothetical protein H7Z13_12220 [Ferruginibacter sp.]|nr:hypothetical protein [Ferruginibacter sp.]
MLLTLTKKKAVIFISAIIVLFAISFISCQKELTGNADDFIAAPPDLTVKVSASVAGFVTDENDIAVNGAVVTVGGTTILTDKYGYFEIKNVQVVKEAAVVTVARPGYFKGIKTWLATAGKSAFFRVKLIPKTIAGTLDAATGGNVTLANGLIISLPAAAIVNAATNAAYTGPVNVSAKWIDPTGNDLNRTMPGDLRGLDTAGIIKLLTTYGMTAVELTGSGGELLQVAGGKKATLTIPLPASLAAGAPATIPLWYFDETVGLWKEEGKAVKSGNTYIGDVSHFSYWNYDVPSNYIKFNCTIVDAKGVPVQNVLVKVSVVNNPQSSGYGYTDSAGYTGGAVPNNAQLLLQVFSEYNCSTPLHSQTFTTTNTNVALGNIKVTAASIAGVTGNIVNCSNGAVTNGFVIMLKNGVSYRYKVDATGAFNFATPLCSGNAVVTLIAEDISALQSGAATSATLVTGANLIGSLTACGTSIQQFINYTINGTSYSMTAPGDSLLSYVNTQTPPPTIYIYGLKSGTNGNSASLKFTQLGIAVNSAQPLASFSAFQLPDSSSMPTPINVTITEYGPVGQFMAGNFTGTFTGPPPANTPYNVTCGFRVRRTQ